MTAFVAMTSLTLLCGVNVGEGKRPAVNGPTPLKRVAYLRPDGMLAVEEKLTKVIVMQGKLQMKLIVRVFRFNYGANIQEKKVALRQFQGGVSTTKTVIFTKTSTYDARLVCVFDARGRKVEGKAMAERLKKPVPVLVSADGEKVASQHLRALNKEILILILPGAKP